VDGIDDRAIFAKQRKDLKFNSKSYFGILPVVAAKKEKAFSYVY
jgi:hypothetical protein